MTRRYLVTGGTGFIGSALVKRLLSEGHHVRVLDNNSRGSLRRLTDVKNDIELVNADIRDADKVHAAAKNMDAVIHLAAVNGTEFFYSRPELVLDVAVRGMLNVVDACRKAGVGDLVFASSSEVYQTPPEVPTRESVPLCVPDVLNPRYSYGGGKIASELIAMNYGRNNFNRVTVFRPHNVYGPDMGWEHVLPQLILRAKDAVAHYPEGLVPFKIQGTGSQTRAFVEIEDFTDGLMTVIKHGKHLNIYHIGTDEEICIADIARKVMAYFGREAELVHIPEPAGATPRRCPDIGKLAALGYRPKISFDDGLPKIADWYVKNFHLRPPARGKQ